jgi:hypothetical protein
MSKSRDRPTHLVPRDAVVAILEKHRVDGKGRAFTVYFTKRTDGEKRVMNARYGVYNKLKAGVSRFDFEEKNLHSVYDMTNHSYKCIPLESIEKLTLDGVIYEVV